MDDVNQPNPNPDSVNVPPPQVQSTQNEQSNNPRLIILIVVVIAIAVLGALGFYLFGFTQTKTSPAQINPEPVSQTSIEMQEPPVLESSNIPIDPTGGRFSFSFKIAESEKFKFYISGLPEDSSINSYEELFSQKFSAFPRYEEKDGGWYNDMTDAVEFDFTSLNLTQEVMAPYIQDGEIQRDSDFYKLLGVDAYEIREGNRIHFLLDFKNNNKNLVLGDVNRFSFTYCDNNRVSFNESLIYKNKWVLYVSCEAEDNEWLQRGSRKIMAVYVPTGESLTVAMSVGDISLRKIVKDTLYINSVYSQSGEIMSLDKTVDLAKVF